MLFSRSLLRSAILLAVAVAAGCDRDVNSVMAPPTVPSKPNALIVPTGYSDVSVGANFACAVRAVDGGLVCWGQTDYDQTKAPTVGTYRQVSAGTSHACALRADYVVVCWGRNYYGEGSPPARTFSQVSAGNGRTCGVRMDNRTVQCWGNAPTPPSGAFTQMSTGSGPTCGVTFPDSRVLCWETYATVPAGAYKQVDAGSGYACGVLSSGSVLCWGQNLHGESNSPTGTYTQVSAAYTHTCAIRASDRGVSCWGQDRVGMLNAPAGAYTKVSAGTSNACAIRASDLALVCWGNTSYGMSSPPGISTAHALPSATFGAGLVYALDTFYLNLMGARVNGFPNAKTFTYQYDCGDGKGYGLVTTLNYAKCPTRVAGTRTVRGKVIDQDGDTASYGMSVPVKLRPQTVTFTSTAPISPVVGTTYTVGVKSTSGLAVAVATTSLYDCARSGNVVTFTTINTCTITADQKGDSTWAAAPRATQSARAIWPFSGFFISVRNQPQVNAMTAGRYIKLIFSLGGNRSNTAPIVPSGVASTVVVACNPNVIPYNVTATTGVGTPGVEYDSATGRYALTWKTDASWAGSCRTVTVTLNDGTRHSLNFKFN